MRDFADKIRLAVNLANRSNPETFGRKLGNASENLSSDNRQEYIDSLYEQAQSGRLPILGTNYIDGDFKDLSREDIEYIVDEIQNNIEEIAMKNAAEALSSGDTEAYKKIIENYREFIDKTTDHDPDAYIKNLEAQARSLATAPPMAVSGYGGYSDQNVSVHVRERTALDSASKTPTTSVSIHIKPPGELTAEQEDILSQLKTSGDISGYGTASVSADKGGGMEITISMNMKAQGPGGALDALVANNLIPREAYDKINQDYKNGPEPSTLQPAPSQTAALSHGPS